MASAEWNFGFVRKMLFAARLIWPQGDQLGHELAAMGSHLAASSREVWPRARGRCGRELAARAAAHLRLERPHHCGMKRIKQPRDCGILPRARDHFLAAGLRHSAARFATTFLPRACGTQPRDLRPLLAVSLRHTAASLRHTAATFNILSFPNFSSKSCIFPPLFPGHHKY